MYGRREYGEQQRSHVDSISRQTTRKQDRLSLWCLRKSSVKESLAVSICRINMVEIETIEDESNISKVSKVTTSDDWTQLMGDDLVMKIISRDRPKNNKEPTAVQPNDAVMIDFVGRLADDPTVTDGPIIQEAKSWFIVVGDGDVLPALELAIRFMDSGSTARVWSNAKYAFSSGTR